MSWFDAAIFVSIAPIAFLLGRHLLRRRRRRRYCVREVPNFLSHDECDRIIELSRPLLEPGLVHGREGNRADKARHYVPHVDYFAASVETFGSRGTARRKVDRQHHHA
ncbi:MAG: hypothetical protein JRG89_23930 [Deltaproteobacteria bacterium]|nr:hypothetical protein [Deltaproteobacteria bacterium]MBW2724020.1 hypothetical protein [Deltaproteobacteria bacterium]